MTIKQLSVKLRIGRKRMCKTLHEPVSAFRKPLLASDLSTLADSEHLTEVQRASVRGIMRAAVRRERKTRPAAIKYARRFKRR